MKRRIKRRPQSDFLRNLPQSGIISCFWTGEAGIFKVTIIKKGIPATVIAI
jgi:hypothetical protein